MPKEKIDKQQDSDTLMMYMSFLLGVILSTMLVAQQQNHPQSHHKYRLYIFIYIYTIPK